MTSPLRKALAGLGIAAMAISGVAASAPDGSEYVERSDRVMMGIGCDRSGDAPTCDTTAYWLGLQAGDSSVGNALTFTPANTATYYTDGTWDAADFAGNSTLQSTYVIDASRDITGQVTLGSFAGVEAAADAAIRVDITAMPADGGWMPIVIGYAEVTKVAMLPGDATFEYTIDIDDSLDGVEVGTLNLSLKARGIAVLTSGFIDGEGGSFFDFPWLELVDAS